MPFDFRPSLSVHSYVRDVECLYVVPEPRQLRLRLDEVTLKRASEIQDLLEAAGRHSTLETVVGMGIEALHTDLFGPPK